MQPKTIEVFFKGTDTHAIINESDFDPALHVHAEEYESVDAEAERKAKEEADRKAKEEANKQHESKPKEKGK